MNRLFFLTAAGLTTAFATATASAAPISIVNADFETSTNPASPGVNNGATEQNQAFVPGWTLTPDASVPAPKSARGLFDPPTLADSLPTSGTNVGFTNSNQGASNLAQIIGLVQAGTYVASVNVGRQTGMAAISSRFQMFSANDGDPNSLTGNGLARVFFNSAGATLFEGASGGWVFGSSTVTPETAGTLREISFTFSVPEGDTSIGDDLAIRMIGESGIQTIWDDVAVDFTPVPEPGSMVIIGLGGVAMLGRRGKLKA